MDTTAPTPDSPLTPNQLIAAIRRTAGGRAPIGVRTIRAAIAAAELPAARIGNRRIVRWGDFVEWIDEHRPEAGAS